MNLDPLIDTLADRIAAKLAERKAAEENPDEMLPPYKIARIYGVRVTQVELWIDSGALMRVPEMSQRRVKRREVEAFATRNGRNGK